MRNAPSIVNCVFLLILVATTGCLKIEQILLLRKDGSGTFEVKYTVPNETSERIKAMLKLTQEMAIAARREVQPVSEDDYTRMLFTPDQSDIKEKIASYEKYGIRINKVKVRNRNAAFEVEIKVEFDDIAKVAEADFFQHYGFSLARTSNGNFLLFTRPITEEPMDPAWDANDTEILSRVTPFLNGFEFKLEIHSPGSIIKTNGERKSRYTSVWLYSFAADPNAVAELQRSRMTVLFDGTGIEDLKDLHQPRTPDETKDESKESG